MIKEKEKIDTFDIECIRHDYEAKLASKWGILEPKMKEAYDILSGKTGLRQAIYDTEIDRQKNFEGKNLFSDNHNIYAGIINPLNFKKGETAIYLFCESFQWLIINYPKEKGIKIFRVYEEIDKECIEESWGLKSTEKWVTSLELAREAFTDVTKYSQKVSGLKVATRPTIKRVIEDINKKNFTWYHPVFDTVKRHYTSDFGHINAVFFNMIVLCVRLKIKGCSI